MTNSTNNFKQRVDSTSNIFANLEALRLAPDAASVGGTTEVLSHIPLRKPNRHEFFRTRRESEMWFATGIFEDREEREVFLSRQQCAKHWLVKFDQ